ncbi:MAG: hypothetical protein WAL63_06885 [Solirubrobacteraceae bacterium]
MTANPETAHFRDDGVVPNSRLPVLIYHDLKLADDPGRAEAAFAANGWRGAWRDGIFPFHHFHSIAHEVLAIVGGTADMTLGGPDGERLTVHRGDVLVLPAGTGHRNSGCSEDLLVVGAYPDGMAWDVRRGDSAEHDEVRTNIAAVPLPRADPALGPDGPLGRLWTAPEPAAAGA